VGGRNAYDFKAIQREPTAPRPGKPLTPSPGNKAEEQGAIDHYVPLLNLYFWRAEFHGKVMFERK